MNYLNMEKRGLDFGKNEDRYRESDINNYRICTIGYTVPLKDGRKMFFEFCAGEKYEYTKNGKRKKVVFPCMAWMNTAFENNIGCCRDSRLEDALYENPIKYTTGAILGYINSISSVHFDAIRFV